MNDVEPMDAIGRSSPPTLVLHVSRHQTIQGVSPMKTRKERIRSRFQLEMLEGRIALSSLGGGGIDDAINGHRHGRGAEVQHQRRGQDDPANHNANDDRGHRHGADDPAGHR
jgi:hypothetical protein